MTPPNDLPVLIVARDARVPSSRAPAWRASLLKAQQDSGCPLCGARFSDQRAAPVADFIVPPEVGGPSHWIANTMLFCSSCAKTRARRDLLDMDQPVSPALLDRRLKLWPDLPHHLTGVGRGRAASVYRDALLRRAAGARMPWVAHTTPDGVWLGHALRCPDGPGRGAHIRVLAEHGAVQRWERGGARLFCLPPEQVPTGLWALIEAGGVITLADPSALPAPEHCVDGRDAWMVQVVGTAAHRRRSTRPNDTPWPTVHDRSEKPTARCQRRRQRREAADRWTREANDARAQWIAAGQSGAAFVVCDALYDRWRALRQRAGNLCNT